jgi:predicted RNA-binding protein with RPS1 domain
MVSTGAFAKLPGLEVEGFIPLREMSDQRIKKPEDALQVGQKVEVKILDIQPAARKMTLSVVQVAGVRQRQEAPQQSKQNREPAPPSGINLGEQFGDILRGALADEPLVEDAAEAQADALAEEACEARVEEPVAPKPRKPRAKKSEAAAEPEATASEPEIIEELVAEEIIEEIEVAEALEAAEEIIEALEVAEALEAAASEPQAAEEQEIVAELEAEAAEPEPESPEA